MKHRTIYGTLVFIAAAAAQAQTWDPDAGRVFLMKRAGAGFDQYSETSSPDTQQWIRTHYWRMQVFTPYFDAKTSWYGNALFYQDTYAIYANQPVPDPSWILRDASGNPLYIDWGCNPSTHTCPQYAGDFSNPGFRQWWIDNVRQELARGNYRGIWLDDVNMDWRVSNGDGVFVNPMDANTGQLMTITDWRRYMADFMERIRRDLPGVEIIHNAIWFAGGDDQREMNPDIQRQIAASDAINIEMGVNDLGLTGGTGIWSLHKMLEYIDHVNALGKRAILDGIAFGDPTNVAARDYGLACYFLISNGYNAIGDPAGVTDPPNWWPGFDVSLGWPLGPRTYDGGIFRREFPWGLVLVNEPQARQAVLNLPGPYRLVDGTPVTSVTLGPGQGVVLLTKAPGGRGGRQLRRPARSARVPDGVEPSAPTRLPKQQHGFRREVAVLMRDPAVLSVLPCAR